MTDTSFGGYPGPIPGAPPPDPTPIKLKDAEFRRERYFEALYFKLLGLKAGGLVKTASRKVRTMEEMQPAELPALFMAVGQRQKMKWQYNQPPHHTLWATIYLYAANPNPSVTADMVLNGLLDGIQAACKPDPGRSTQTLNDIAFALYMGGEQEIEIFAGPNGERAAAIVPIQIEIFQ